LNYPHQFNFEGARNFSFELPPTATGNYLEITNFNFGTSAPVLYDLTNKKRYVGDISTPGFVKFALPASAQTRSFAMSSVEATNINFVNEFKQRNFINFLQTDKQGNYLIITNPYLYTGPNGNPIDRYKAYRSSSAGGSFNAIVYESQELIDRLLLASRTILQASKFYQIREKHFASPPLFVFLIGKGVSYNEYEDKAVL
jgi:hypothetical protein